MTSFFFPEDEEYKEFNEKEFLNKCLKEFADIRRDNHLSEEELKWAQKNIFCEREILL